MVRIHYVLPNERNYCNTHHWPHVGHWLKVMRENMKITFQDETTNRIVFHFNKASLKDKTIPMWVIKHKGVSYYVDHVQSTVGWNTKETPENEHTQGSIQFKGKLQIVEENGKVEARIS